MVNHTAAENMMAIEMGKWKRERYIAKLWHFRFLYTITHFAAMAVGNEHQ
jgi:hypothetical protein